ncbi:MAG: hypothetical protein JO213_11485 [Alphaproteobacteria bacterium]|nr:hypothetical protein [Alphaproteobacteria bacterium]
MMLRWLGVGLLLGAALAGGASAQSVTQFDGQYVGELTLARVVDGDCTPPPLGALYPLTISGGKVRFAYVPRFSTTLSGTIGGNGVFHAAGRAKHGVVQMNGRIEGNRVTASITSPSCAYSFQTK